jgi:hypothetical protein
VQMLVLLTIARSIQVQAFGTKSYPCAASMLRPVALPRQVTALLCWRVAAAACGCRSCTGQTVSRRQRVCWQQAACCAGARVTVHACGSSRTLPPCRQGSATRASPCWPSLGEDCGGCILHKVCCRKFLVPSACISAYNDAWLRLRWQHS